MNTFGIYIFQWNKNFVKTDGNIKAFDTTMIGEVCMNSAKYKGMSIEEACKARINEELSSKLGTRDNDLISSVVYIDFLEIKSDKPKDVDKDIHKILEKIVPGKRIFVDKENSATEMFNLGTDPMFYIEQAIKQYTGNVPRLNFVPRNVQQDCIQQIDNYFKTNSEKRFLIFAVCRFGKTSTTLYSLIKNQNKKNILILSSKCDVANSWQADFYKWDFTLDYSFITKSQIKANESCLNKNNKVCFMSFQTAADATKEMSKDEEKWCEKLAKVKWDAVVIDECHFGAQTPRSKKLLDLILNNSKAIKIELSATPYKLLNENKYTAENSFIYTLIDEPKFAKKNEYVKVKMFHLNMSLFKFDGTRMLKSSPDEITFNKIVDFFASEDFSWDGFFTNYSEEQIGYIVNKLYDKTIIPNGGKNIAIVVHKVEHGEKLINGLLPYSKKFNLFNVCGTNKTSIFEINQALETACVQNDKPVIIVSCNRYMTGTTMQYLDSVMFMRQVQSAETYVQYMLRGKNWYVGRKRFCNVFDLTPNAFIYSSAFTDLIMSESKARKTTPSNVAKAYSTCISMFEVNDYGIATELPNFTDIFENNLYTCHSNRQMPQISLLLNNILKDIPLDLLKYLKQKSTNKIQINSTKDIHKLKAEKLAKKKSKNDTEKKINVEEVRNKLVKILSTIPTFIKFFDLKDIDVLFNDTKKADELCENFEYWTNGFNIGFLIDIKNSMTEFDWNQFKTALLTTSKNLPEDRDEWTFDAPRAINNWRL